MRQSIRGSILGLLLLSSPFFSFPLAAAPSSVPGGTNQADGVQGPRGTWLFNGRYRLRFDSIAEAALSDYQGTMNPDPGQKVLLVQFIMKNGEKTQNSDLMNLSLSDADDITQTFKDYHVNPNPTPPTVQGGAWKVRAVIAVPKDYTPTRLVISFPTDRKHRVFRVNIL